MILIGVYHDHIEEIWPKVEPMVRDGVKNCMGLFDADDVMEALKSRNMQLWAACDGMEIVAIAVTEIRDYPKKKVCDFILSAGRNHRLWIKHMDTISEWAREQGCDAIFTSLRGGYTRYFNEDTGWTFGERLAIKELV